MTLSDPCCNEFELTWSHQYIPGIKMQSPIGNYIKQGFKSNDKIVYYNAEAKYYLYNRGDAWVVSSLVESKLSIPIIRNVY